MKKYKFMIFLIVFLLICSPLTLTHDALALDDPDIKANAVFLYEISTKQTLYSKNEDAQIAPASTTKIMTALLSVEAIESGKVSEDDIVEITENVNYNLTNDASTVKLKAGERIKFIDLLYCALVASANEACNAIAEYVSGDIDSFIALMNERAAELGCTGTHFANANGLTCDNLYTTAHDLCRIYEAAYSLPLFRKICETETYSVPPTNISDVRRITNTNKLLVKKSDYYYEYCTGGKTGYTDDAGYCLVSSAEHNELSLIAVVMGAESVKLSNGVTQSQNLSESKRLFEWAFSNFEYKTVIDTKTLISEIPVKMGSGADSVVLCPASQITALLPKDVQESDLDLDVDIDVEEITAPVEAGEAFGKITVSYDGKVIGSTKLVANSTIDLQRIEYMKNEIGKTMSSPIVKITAVVLLLMIIGYIAFIIRHNAIRRQKREEALEAHRIEMLNKKPTLTTGKSFEEIESIYETSGKK